MRAINHALTGAVVGLAVEEPLLAMPLAVVSHYVCDLIPHYGANLPGDTELKSKRFRDQLLLDAALCAALVLVLLITRPHHWFLAAVCAFLAAAPDFLSINKYVTIRAGKKWKPGIYTRFAHGIQWFERPIGAVVEVAWMIAAIVVMVPYLTL